MNDPIYRKKQIALQKADIIIKTLGIILGICIGVWQFSIQQEAQIKNEFKRTLWKERLETYTKLSELVGQIMATVQKDSLKFTNAANDFSTIYWGKMNFIEDSSVTRELTNFRYNLAGFNPMEKDTDKIVDLTASANELIGSLKLSSNQELTKLLQ